MGTLLTRLPLYRTLGNPKMLHSFARAPKFLFPFPKKILTSHHFSISQISNRCFSQTPCFSSELTTLTLPTSIYKDFNRDYKSSYELWRLIEEEHGKLNLKDVGDRYPYEERSYDEDDEFEFDVGDLNSDSESDSDSDSDSDSESDSYLPPNNYYSEELEGWSKESLVSTFDRGGGHVLLKKINDIDIMLEETIDEYDHISVAGKRKLIGEKIRDLVEKRNILTHERSPFYRRESYDVELIDVHRTCKRTKDKLVVQYTVVIACGVFDHGQAGLAKAKSPILSVAQEKAYKRCFQKLGLINRIEGRTIEYPCGGSYRNTKVYLWPASPYSGIKACNTIRKISNLLNFRYIISKVVGSKNPYYIAKATLRALGVYRIEFY